jgi:hypothetical protein
LRWRRFNLAPILYLGGGFKRNKRSPTLGNERSRPERINVAGQSQQPEKEEHVHLVKYVLTFTGCKKENKTEENM